MRLTIVGAPAPLKICFPRVNVTPTEDFDNVKICRKRGIFVALRPVSCFASASTSTSSASTSSPSSSPPREVSTEAAIAAGTDSLEKPASSSSVFSSDFASFIPPPPALPVTPKDLASDLPFQYWYSYVDLPPGVPKRRPKSHLAVTVKSGEKRNAPPGLDEGGRKSSGGLWEAVLAIDSENHREPPKVGRRGRGRPRGRDGGVGSGESETGILSTDSEKSSNAAAASSVEEKEGEDSPLTEKEINKLIGSCHGTSRQINIGWEGWSPNYVPLVHSYWKRSQVCKVKCKGVVTLDMNSMCNKLEVETGGKVIYRTGGAVYLFRGRNYNYWRDSRQLPIKNLRVRTRFPKRLPAPCILTDDINALRARGRELPALCKPGKHGVYLTLLDDVRKAFETEELVRVNCQGFHSKNLKSLGSHLQRLVPCELISFEFEHILMWRSKDKMYSNKDIAL